jgi:DNA-binding transcriptional LysR family regulator
MEVFLAVVRYGSISKAARQLHFSQPAVSVIIQSLEKELGVPLLVRTPRLTHSVVQTPQGEEFKKFAESVVEQYRTLRHRLALSGEPAALTLNSGRSSRAMILARIARHFSETYPAVPVRLRTCMDSATAMGELLSGDCDISLSSYDPEDSRYVSVPILTDPLVLIAPSDMELDDSIALDALPALPMIMREETCYFYKLVRRELAARGLDTASFNCVLRLYDDAAVLQAVTTGGGCGFIPQSLLENSRSTQNLKVIHVRRLKIESKLYLVRAKNVAVSASMSLFWEFASSLSK